MRPLISAFLALTPVAFAQYVLEDDYLAGGFASHWNFFTDDDPTNGYVDYVDEATAVSSGLLSTLVNGSVFLGVDSTNPGTGRGRPSVRIESKKNYNNGGLFIIDLAHMPGGQCGSWPAYWLIGPGGADTGEVDMIEAINTDTTNLMSVKTGRECTISQQVMTGTLETTDCNVNTGGVVGCSIDSASPFTYGGGFNSLDGGVYATEWVAEGVTIWYFQRSAIPADITAGTPDPSLWGVPLAKFLTSCNLNENLINQQLIMNIDFCGDYAGNPFYWDNDPTCKSQADTCNDFVQNNPSAFEQTYWLINSLRVYQQVAPSTTTSSSTSIEPPTSSLTTTTTSSPLPETTTLTTTTSPPPEPTTTTSPPPEPTTTTSPPPEPTTTTSPPPEPTTTTSPPPEPTTTTSASVDPITTTTSPSPEPTTTSSPPPDPTTTSSPSPDTSSTSSPSPTPSTTSSPSPTQGSTSQTTTTSSEEEPSTTSLTSSPPPPFTPSSSTTSFSSTPIPGPSTTTSSQQIGPTDLTTTSTSLEPPESTTSLLTTTASSSGDPIPDTTTSYSSLSTSIPDFSSSSQSSINPQPGSTTTTASSQSTIGPIPGSTTTSLEDVSTSSSSSTLGFSSTSSQTIGPNPGSTTTSLVDVSTSSSSSTPGFSSTSSQVIGPIPGSTTSSTSQKPGGSWPSLPAGDKGWDIGHGQVTTTIRATWIEPCPTGLTTITTSISTTHCGCRDEPVPTFSFTTTTTICPPGWPITTPYVVTKPVPPPMPTAHTKITTTDSIGKIITITRGLFAPTKTVVVPVTVVPYAPGSNNGHGGPPAAGPGGSVITISGAPVTLTPGAKPTSGAPSVPVNGSPNGSSPGSGSGQGNGDQGGAGPDSGNGAPVKGGHDAGGAPSGDGWSGAPGTGDSSGHPGDNTVPGHASGPAVPPASYTGDAPEILALGTTLLLSIIMVTFIFVELSLS